VLSSLNSNRKNFDSVTTTRQEEVIVAFKTGLFCISSDRVLA